MATLNSSSAASTAPSPGHNAPTPPPDTSSPSSPPDPITKDDPAAATTTAPESMRPSEPGARPLESGCGLVPPKEIGEPQEEAGGGGFPPKELGAHEDRPQEEGDAGLAPLPLSNHLVFTATGEACLVAQPPPPGSHQLLLPKGFPRGEVGSEEEPGPPLLAHPPPTHLTALHIQHGFDPMQGFSSSDQILSHDTSAPSPAACEGRDGAFWSYQLAPDPPGDPKDGPTGCMEGDPRALFWLCLLCRLGFSGPRAFVGHTQSHGVRLSPAQHQALRGHPAVLQGGGEGCRALLSFLEPKRPAQPALEAPLEGSGGDAAEPPGEVNVAQSQDGAPEAPSHPGEEVLALSPRSPAPAPWGPSPPQAKESPTATGEAGPDWFPEGHDEEGGLCPPLNQSSPASKEGAALPAAAVGSPEEPGDPPPSYRSLADDYAPAPATFQGLSLSSHMSLLHSRNSCKTLKCPKCNWHYKYQQTLDVHMREKHPESNSHCSYCSAGGAHPRLARGESYNCGYKPYRCDVCNYSTTTKGNLSIHMQSDKHLANLQGYPAGPGGQGSPPEAALPPAAAAAAADKEPKAKSSWQCKVCSYETNISRNLRIHMTSEKHMQNVLLLHQGLPLGLPPGLVGPGPPPPAGTAPATPPDLFQYFGPQALGPPQAPLPGPGLRPDKPLEAQLLLNGYHHLGGPARKFPAAPPAPGSLSPDAHLPPSQLLGSLADGLPTSPPPEDASTLKVFRCLVCQAFSTDSLELLLYHCSVGRSLPEAEWKEVAGDTHRCKLCCYGTQLKANFQLHLKTDKHAQKYQLAAHLREGGGAMGTPTPAPLGEGAPYGSIPPLHLRCNICDFESNSKEKMQLHARGAAHEENSQVYKFLQEMEGAAAEPGLFRCLLCAWEAPSRLAVLHHLRAPAHRDAQAQRRLQLLQSGPAAAEDGLSGLHSILSFSHGPLPTAGKAPGTPLAEPPIPERDTQNKTEPSAPEDAEEKSGPVGDSTSQTTVYCCPYCSFLSPECKQVRAHALSQHAVPPRYRCPLCQEQLVGRPALHFHLSHLHNVVPECVEKLLLVATTVEMTFSTKVLPAPSTSPQGEGPEPPAPALEPGSSRDQATEGPHLTPEASPGALPEPPPPAAEAPDKPAGSPERPPSPAPSPAPRPEAPAEEPVPAPPAAEEEEGPAGEPRPAEPAPPDTRHPLTYRKTTNFALDKFLDPARPYKCTVCKESFTQKNILLVHYNSVSHLHKMKKAAVDPAGPARGEAAPTTATAASDKPFKCTVCRVSYNQSSTLEIHMRSVLHQTRSRGARPDPKADGLERGPEDAKEGEMEGEVGLEKRGPDPGGFASGLPFLSPPPPPLDMHRFPAPLFAPPVLPPFPLVPESLLKLQQQQLLLPFYLHDLKVTPKLALAGPAPLLSLPPAAPPPPPAPKSELAEREWERPPVAEEGNEAGPASPPNPAPNEAARTAAKALLENFGFELVIQYNEGKQAAPPPPTPPPPEALGSGSDKLACGACGKLFSNMLILKTHEEHVHRRFLPFEALSRYAAQFRKSYDSLYPPPAEPPRPPEGPLESPAPQLGPPFLVAESDAGGARPPEERGRAGRWPPEEEDGARGSLAPLLPAGRRFSRTKFTEFQTQALQSFFETSAYPKDGEVERLAGLLGLASRVVVVWFQNARQKARKHASEVGPAPPGGGPGGSSGCRRCHASFSCVFELVRHLKKCYDDQPPEEEEEEAERGDEEEEVEEEDADEEQGPEPAPGPEGPSPEPLDREEPNQAEAAKPGSKEPEGRVAASPAPTHACDQCAAAFPSHDLLAAHRRLHFLPVVPPGAAPHLLDLPLLVFGERNPLGAGAPTVPGPPLKRKHEDGSLSPTGSEVGGGGEGEPPRDKRLRTTILPEQLEILYRWYMQDSNPTRKMLDCISEEVGLKKRVVQVWFQNTRARERKGQFRGTPGGVPNPAAKPPGPPAPGPAPFPKFNLLLGKVEEGPGREVPKREAPVFPYPPVNSAAAPLAFLPPAKEPSAPTPEPPAPVPLPPAPTPGEDEGPEEPSKASPESEACSPCAGDLSDSSASSLAEPESPGAAGASGGGGGGAGAPDGLGQRRYRTQMSSLQLKIMKACYEAYRTPTMQECEVLGEEIGLPKRVIQVWFQNARAKEKKAKLQGAAAGGGGVGEGPLGAQRADCPYCDVKYDFYVSCRGHLFSRQHLAKLKEAVRAQLKNESKCYDLAPAPEAPPAPKAPPAAAAAPASLPLGTSPALPRLAPVLLSGPALAQPPLGSLAPFSSGPAASSGLLGLATSVLPATTVVQTGPGCPLPQRPGPDPANTSTTGPPDPAPGPPAEPSGDTGSAERKPVAAPANASADALKNLKALKATVPALLGGQFLPFPLPPAGGATPPAVFGPQLQGAYFQQLYGMKKGLFPMNPVIPQTLIGLLPNTLLQPLPQAPEPTATAPPKPSELPAPGEGEAGEADELLAGSAGISTVDVTHRYLCRQCKMAFDGEAPAAAHQRSFCFFGRGSGGPMPAPLRVPVCTYHCLACEVLLSGREALASHLRSSAHRRKAAPAPGGPPITVTNAATAATAAVAFAKEEARLPHTDSNPKTTTTSTLLAL
ncbi:zinc finger homeobox protein 2 [Sorex araneus]|uniref:zinc finger homeobox protein 2 n=1 Tax=Sorex araneus TaxID=42254 RepID=UPI0024336EFC|nr:zinc finger homeobox protein 2 [Sorex araneus]